MDEMSSIRIFLCVAEEGSFSAAGRKLHLSPSSVSRQVVWLEEHLRARLINRSTRCQNLTEAGHVFYGRMKAVVKEISSAKAELQSVHDAVKGTLRVCLRTSTATTVVIPALPAFLDKYPELTIDIQLSDERKDLISHQIDVAVWGGELPDSEIVARKLVANERILCASRSYIDRYGEPATPAEVKDHSCILYNASTHGATWVFERDGESTSVEVGGKVSSENGLVLYTAALSGLGMIVVQEYTVRKALSDGRLVRLLPDYVVKPSVVPHPLYVVFPSSKQMSAKVRVFVDFIVGLFANEDIGGVDVV